MGQPLVDLNSSIWLNADSVVKKTDFPIDIFPIQVQSIINELEVKLNFPLEFSSASFLGLVSALIGNQLELEVKKGWTTRSGVSILQVCDRGHLKSQPMRLILQPLIKMENKLADEYDKKLVEFKENLKEDKNTEPPKQDRMSMHRFSPETIFGIHNNNPKGLIIICNEAKGWFGTFNQYSNNADEALWCDLIDGGYVTRDTISHGHQRIKQACVSILGGIQPSEICKFLEQNTENGLVDRIFFVYPDDLEKKEWTEDEVTDFTLNQIQIIFNRLYDSFKYSGEEYVQRVKYTSEAKRKVFDWQKKMAALVDEKDDRIFTGIEAKAETFIHRFAMILEALHGACEDKPVITEIGETAIDGAIKLMNYFIDQGLKVRRLIGLKGLNKKDLWFDLLPKEFVTKEAVVTAKKYELGSERTVKNWLKTEKRLVNLEHGKYKKL